MRRSSVHNKSIRENIRKLHKKLAASLTIAIFILGTLAIMSPVQAHYTLGLNEGTSPYHYDDFDPHVTGVIGYVWPGSGENAYAGYPGVTGNAIPPGYIAPWADNGVNPPGASPTWYQLAGNAYAPFGAVLVGSTGDLIFAINATAYANAPFPSANPTLGWGSWDILIPPEFNSTSIKPEQVVTTLTNDYSGISVTTLDMNDRYAPGWTLVRIVPDGNNNGGVSITGATSFLNFTSKGEWYYARINGVTAPSIAGKYFFKMFLGGNGASGACSGCQPDYWVPTANWPVMLVKGETDPAIIYGTIFYGGYNQSLYGKPIELAGMVKAVMTTKLDPYTGNTMTGPLTNAVGYFNSTAMGHYEVEGVAPGVYDIYASAAGYPDQLIATGVRVLKGQSLLLNGYLNPGVVIQGNVYTKHGFGEEPWPRTDYIKIEIYSTNPTVNVGSPLPAANSKLVSWSPLPCVTAGPGALYMGGNTYDASTCGGTWLPGTSYGSSYVAFPWVEYGNPYFNPTTATASSQFNGVYFKPPVDEQGVGPAQQWFVQGGTTTPFSFQFGEKGEYGAPSVLDGHVPQMNATWIDGLQAGRYYVRAWVTQYVQTELDGLTFHEVSFDVAANEWAGDVVVPIDLRLTDYVNKTVYFHDTPGTLMTNPISTGATVLDGGLYDAQTGNLWAWNYTTTFYGGVAFITWYGFNDRWDGRDYGIPAGTYTPKIYAKGYEQQTFEMVSLSLSGTPVYISDHLYRGVGFNITIYSTDFEQPRVDRNWLYPGEYIDLVIYNEPGHNVSATRTKFATQVLGTTTTKCDTGHYASQCVNGVWWGYQSGNAFYQGGSVNGNEYDVFTAGTSPSWSAPSAFDSGQYSFSAGTYGYVQKKTFSVYALKGEIADIKINLVIGVNLTILIDFKKEKILTPTMYNMSARVRVFDDSGKLVGEWMSSEGTTAGTSILNYIPARTSTLTVKIAGLPEFYGDPVFDQGGFALGDAGGYFMNLGIDGSPNYNGGYTVEVDFVNWYLPTVHAVSPTWFTAYYPPPPGLLMGESFHTVPGHPQNPFGWTEVGALSSTFLGHSMAPNHLGPYAQEGVWSLPNAYLSGEASGEWEVDLRGYLAGTVVGFTWSGEYRTESWATVSIFGADNYTYNSYSSDGYYEFYTAPGAYKMTISMPGYASQTFPLVVADGQATSGGNLQLQQSNLPIPEFSGLAVVAFSALAASLYLLRRRRP